MNLQEFIRRILRENNTKSYSYREGLAGIYFSEINIILNKIMSKRYGWWKSIEIEDLGYSNMGNQIGISGVLNVDFEWGLNKWEEQSYREFPGNDKKIFLYSIMDSDEEKEVSNVLNNILKSITNFHNAEYTNINDLKLKFV